MDAVDKAERYNGYRRRSFAGEKPSIADGIACIEPLDLCNARFELHHWFQVHDTVLIKSVKQGPGSDHFIVHFRKTQRSWAIGTVAEQLNAILFHPIGKRPEQRHLPAGKRILLRNVCNGKMGKHTCHTEVWQFRHTQRLCHTAIHVFADA